MSAATISSRLLPPPSSSKYSRSSVALISFFSHFIVNASSAARVFRPYASNLYMSRSGLQSQAAMPHQSSLPIFVRSKLVQRFDRSRNRGLFGAQRHSPHRSSHSENQTFAAQARRKPAERQARLFAGRYCGRSRESILGGQSIQGAVHSAQSRLFCMSR